MKTEEILNKIYKERNITLSTTKGYESSVERYEKLHNMTLHELIQEAYTEEDERIPLRKRKIKTRLKEYRQALVDEGLRNKTVTAYLSKMMTIYRHFEIEIPVLPQHQFEKEYETNYFDLPTKKDIRTALALGDFEWQSLILFMASSGTAKAETLSLTVKQFLKGTEEYHNTKISDENIPDILSKLSKCHETVPVIYLRRIKTKKYYYTCCSPEASDKIVEWLKLRDNLKCDDKIWTYTHSFVISLFQRINDLMDWGRRGPYRYFRSHALRKFYASNIGLSPDMVDLYQGRSKNKVHETYIKVNPVKLKEDYKQVMDNVYIGRLPMEEIIKLHNLPEEKLKNYTPPEEYVHHLKKTDYEIRIIEKRNEPPKPVEGEVEIINRKPETPKSTPVTPSRPVMEGCNPSTYGGMSFNGTTRGNTR